MTPGHRKSTDAVHRSRRTWRWAPALMLAATALLAACDGSSIKYPFIGDTTPPTVVITEDVSAAAATRDVTFTFTFSKDVGTSFTKDSVAVWGGTKGAFTKQDETVYKLVVTPNSNATGTIAVSVPARAFSDLAGNANTAAASAHLPFDTRPLQMILPVTFNSPVAYGLLGFDGAENSTIVDDPAGGTNKVARVVKSAAAQAKAGTTLTDSTKVGLASKIPFDMANTRMTVKVYSPDAGIPVRLKVEDAANSGISCVTEATNTVAKMWETLTFDFGKPVSGTAALNFANTYDKVSIFFNFGVDGATAGEKTYYFDDVAFIGGTSGPSGSTGTCTAAPCIGFEGTDVAFNSFEGLISAAVANDPVDATNKVAKFVKGPSGQPWAGATVYTVAADQSVPAVGFSTSKIITLRVNSPAIGTKIRLKAEDSTDPTISMEVDAFSTKANQWETLTFDFTTPAAGVYNPAKTYNKVSIFPDFQTAVTANTTYYFDELNYTAASGGGGGPSGNTGTCTAAPCIGFEGANVAFNPFEGLISAAVANDPVDATNKVAKLVKGPSGQPWAGATVYTVAADQSVPAVGFSTSKIITLRVNSPAVGQKTSLKVENAADPGVNVIKEVPSTKANQWETLTFDFASPTAGVYNPAKTYNKISIFPDYQTAVTANTTYYYDELKYTAASGGGGGAGSGSTGTCTAAPCIDFSGANVAFEAFEGLVSAAVVNDPVDATNKVAKYVKGPAGQPWAGATVYTNAATKTVDAIGFATSKIITLRVYSPAIGTKIRLKAEDGTDVNVYMEVDAFSTKANQWETLTFDFTTPATGVYNPAKTYNKISIFPEFLTAVTAETSYYFDELKYTAAAGGGGGPVSLTTIDFEPSGFGAGLTWNVFENSDNPPLQFVANPASSGINTSATVAKFTARQAGQPWAGTEIAHGQLTPFALDASHNKVKIMVYKSIISDVGIKFAKGDGGSTGEIKVPNTQINQWEELTFDFSAVVSNPVNQTIDQIIVFPDFNARTGENIIYFDNIRLTN